MGLSGLVLLLALGSTPDAVPLAPRVEIEEDVYTYEDARNGAGPLWCSGSTCLVRVGDRLFASGLETIPGASPLNNCRWVLWERDPQGWRRVQADEEGRTREPSPIAAFPDGRVLLSVNPTLATDPEPGGGPARPDVLQFDAADPSAPPEALAPAWDGQPAFSEHSYRSLAADAEAGELILFQNIGYTHAEWAFRDRDGRWGAQGRLEWPWGAEYDEPGPIRVCYPNVALKGRAVHFFGVSDIVEPYRAWRDYKRTLTGREWDYDFRRLFYTWTPDITQEPFSGWVEIASRDATCGWLSPGDLWLAPDGAVHLLWSDRALDERLREAFFPGATQSHALRYAVVRDGAVVRRATILEATEGTPGLAGSAGRFHATPDGRLFVVHLATGTDADGRNVVENRVVEILPDGNLGTPVPIPFDKPFASFFTTTVRAGSPPSGTLELLGVRAGTSNTISYARVRLLRAEGEPDAVVYRGEYPGWPWVARAPGGRLVCVWREGERHMFSAEGRLMIATSDDGGLTWPEPRVFHDEPGIDDRNVAILALSDTDWLVAYNTYTADNQSRVHTLRTRDGGRTWSAPQRLSDLDARTRGAPIKLSTGELVLPFYREPNFQSYAAVSADDGATWDLVPIENAEGFLGDEWTICELPDGRLVGIIRNSAPEGDGTFFKTESRDRGRSWSRPAPTNLRDTRSRSPAQVFVHGGRPVVLHADARMVSVAMAVSDDPELLRWDVDGRLACYRYRADGEPIADGSYPVSVPVGGNRRLIVDYEIDGDEHRIAGRFVELPDAWFREEPRDEPIRSADVFVERTDGYFAYRIPALETAPDGTLLAFAEARKYNLEDPGFGKQDIDLVLKRSTDGGRTWSPMQVIEDPGELWSAANPATVVDRTNGRIWLLYLRCKPERNTNTARPGTDDSQVLARTSDDVGKTWSEPIDLTAVSRDLDDPTWRVSVVGPGGMIQDRRGRLLAAVWKFEPFANFTLVSDDHGTTWRRGPFVPGSGDECQLVELSDGRLLMDIRQGQGPHRLVSTSADGGATWSPRRPGIGVTPVACAIERYTSTAAGDDRDRILWTGPKGPDRRDLVVRISYDEGESFPVERPIAEGFAAYSDLSILEDRSVGVLWERGEDHGYQAITFTRLTREFLEPPDR